MIAWVLLIVAPGARPVDTATAVPWPGGASEDGAEVADGPAPLPATAPEDAPALGALGDLAGPPLPGPPPDVARARVEQGPWFGRGWVGLALGGSLSPIDRKAGRALALGAYLEGGLRLHRHVGLATRLGTYVGSVGRADGYDANGERVLVTSAGRTTTWDAARLRAILPVRRRLEPWLEVGGGLAVERPPFASTRRAWGSFVSAVGLGIWVAPRITLQLAVEHRLLPRPGELRQSMAGWLALQVHFGR